MFRFLKRVQESDWEIFMKKIRKYLGFPLDDIDRIRIFMEVDAKCPRKENGIICAEKIEMYVDEKEEKVVRYICPILPENIYSAIKKKWTYKENFDCYNVFCELENCVSINEHKHYITILVEKEKRN